MGDNFTLCFRNLSYNTTRQTLEDKVSPITKVIDIRVKNRNGKKGYAFVEVENEEAGKKVIDELNNKELDGQTISVEVATSKPHSSDRRDRRDRRRYRRDDRRSRDRRDRSPPRRSRHRDYSYSDDDYDYDYRRRSYRSRRSSRYDYSDSDDYSRRRRDSPPRRDRRSDRDSRRGDYSASD